MPKEAAKRGKGEFSKAAFLKITKRFKSFIKKLVVSLKPYLAYKYWPVYLLSFGLGLYLWGPSHGWQKINSWKLNAERQPPKTSSVETLRSELNRLKQQLKAEQQLKKVEPVFDPRSFSRPALGKVVQGFEWAGSQKSWRLHPGVDIGIPEDSNIIAAAAGKISKIEKTAGGRFAVTVNHGSGWESIYSELAGILVREGQAIIKGVIIGTSSPEGAHLKAAGFHFGIYHNGQPVDPKNIIEGLY